MDPLRWLMLCLLLILLLPFAAFGARPLTDEVLLFEAHTATRAEPATATFNLPERSLRSAELVVTVSGYAEGVGGSLWFELDEIGGLVSSGLAPSFAEGWLEPGPDRELRFDLGRRFRMEHSKRSNYVVVTDAADALLVDYLDQLATPGEHSIRCYLADPAAGAVKLSAKLLLTFGRRPLPAPPSPLQIVTDAPEVDPRFRIAFDRLRQAAEAPALGGCRFLIGKAVTEAFIKPADLAGLGPEGYLIKSSKSKGKTSFWVSGTDWQGIAYGTVRLARLLLASPEAAQVNLKLNPALPLREEYEEHNWGNPGDLARYMLLLDRYFEEGINMMNLPTSWYDAPPEYFAGESKYTWENWDTVHQTIAYAHSLGIQVWLVEDPYLNPLALQPTETLKAPPREEWEWLGQSNQRDNFMMCLSAPFSLELLAAHRTQVWSRFPDADGVLIYFGDPGGCWHPQCLPHGKKNLELLRDFYEPLAEKVNPALKLRVTTWGLSLEDTTYLVDQLDDFPERVVGLQIPPTAMRPGTYLTFEPERAALIRRASEKLPTVLQQFHEGVGFQDAWVDGWEHPMPRQMTTNFRGVWQPGSALAGNYGSPFELSHQLVDLRIGMEWGWFPEEDASAIISQFGDEQFGPGVGPDFARAMQLMEDYWAAEARRFHFDTNRLTNQQFAQVKKSLGIAQKARASLLAAGPKVIRLPLYYKGFVDLATLMELGAKVNLKREEALRLSEARQLEDATVAAEEALLASQQVVQLATASERYNWLVGHPWWRDNWAIGKRPAALEALVEQVRHPVNWVEVPLDTPELTAEGWEPVGEGTVEFTRTGPKGAPAAVLTVKASDTWALIEPRQFVNPPSGEVWRVEVDAQVLSGVAMVYADWFGASTITDGVNIDIGFYPDKKWHTYRLDVPVPPNPEGAPLALRLVAYGTPHQVALSKVRLFRPEVGP